MKRNEEFLKRVKDAATNDIQREAIKAATKRLKDHKEEAYVLLDEPEKLRAEASLIKSEAIDNLEQYLEEFTENVRIRGGKVHYANNSTEAVNYVINLAKEKKSKLVVKSKSMVTEEIELNHGLEESGISVVETDLGERIIQLANERPSHILAPAMHKTRFQVAELFSKESGNKIEADPEVITQEARRSLRKNFLDADIGISGVNFAIAETGTLILVTNEGNGRLVTSLPQIHIAIMGIEKIVPNLKDALKLLQLLPRTATGQKLTCYTSIINGAIESNDSNREFHVIILDNGRRKMKDDPHMKEGLSCIKCGACSSICPTYKIVGGHVFGSTYSGPIGIPWTAYTGDANESGQFSDLCISCGLCETICPVEIDIPKLIMKTKEKHIENNGQSKTNLFIAKLDSYSELASNIAPITNIMLQNNTFRWMMEKTIGIDRRRPLPEFHRKTFQKSFKAKSGPKENKVAYFYDVYANFNDPDLGFAVTEILERNNSEIILPIQKHSGMPLFAYGNIGMAEELMKFNIKSLYSAIEKGYQIVASEPTAAYCIKKLYPEFISSHESKIVSENTYEFFEFLENLEDNGRFNDDFKIFDKRIAAYHVPCHSKNLLPTKPVKRFLERIGFEVQIVDHGCCGIAGTFGFKQGWEGYDLSKYVGKELFEHMADPSIDIPVTESSVCKMQIEQFTNRTVYHPAKLLRNAYKKTSI